MPQCIAKIIFGWEFKLASPKSLHMGYIMCPFNGFYNYAKNGRLNLVDESTKHLSDVP